MKLIKYNGANNLLFLSIAFIYVEKHLGRSLYSEGHLVMSRFNEPKSAPSGFIHVNPSFALLNS